MRKKKQTELKLRERVFKFNIVIIRKMNINIQGPDFEE